MILFPIGITTISPHALEVLTRFFESSVAMISLVYFQVFWQMFHV